MRSDCSEEQSDQGQRGLENDTLQKHGWKLKNTELLKIQILVSVQDIKILKREWSK